MTTTTPPKEAEAVEFQTVRILTRLNNLYERVIQYSSRLASIRCRLHGEPEAKPEGEGGRIDPTGTLAQIDIAISNIQHEIDEQDNLITQLERV